MQHLALWSPTPSRNVLPLASTTALSHDLFLIFDSPFAVPFGGLHLSHSEPFLHKLAHSYWDLIPHTSQLIAFGPELFPELRATYPTACSVSPPRHPPGT